MKVVLDLDTPVTINRLTITQQPVAGTVAGVVDLLVVTDTGARILLLSGPVSELQVAVVFAPLSIVHAEWGLLQSVYHPIPVHLSHERTSGGLHVVAPV